jgi:hypothetical protein
MKIAPLLLALAAVGMVHAADDVAPAPAAKKVKLTDAELLMLNHCRTVALSEWKRDSLCILLVCPEAGDKISAAVKGDVELGMSECTVRMMLGDPDEATAFEGDPGPEIRWFYKPRTFVEFAKGIVTAVQH